MKLDDLTTEQIKYRKLTFKSTLGFGKYSDLTIYSISCIEKEYLGWVYFTFPNIDFFDDVLEDASIDIELRWDKKNVKLSSDEMNRRFGLYKKADFNKKVEVAEKALSLRSENGEIDRPLAVHIAKNMLNKERKRLYSVSTISSNNKFRKDGSKYMLQQKNHGHI